MADHCARCRSTEVRHGLDGYRCIHCGAHTIDGEVKRVEVVGVTTTKDVA